MTMMTITNIPYLDRIDLPETEPVSVEEVKLALRIDGEDEDEYLSLLIKAAREAAEEYLRRSIVTQSWQLQYDQYVPSIVNLPRGPVQIINHVKTFDYMWEESVVSPDNYRLNAGKDCVVFEAVPMGMVIQIKYTTGYGDQENIPQQMKQGIICHVANMYDGRVSGGEMPDAARSLYAPYKIFRL